MIEFCLWTKWLFHFKVILNGLRSDCKDGLLEYVFNFLLFYFCLTEDLKKGKYFPI